MTLNFDKLSEELNNPYILNKEDIEKFRNNGYIKLKDVFSKELLDHYGDIITKKVIELNTMHIPMEKRDTYQKAFLQIVNLWLKDKTVREFVFGKRLAKIASDLLGTKGVRMYHDQALYKEAGGGITPWHADQFYWPLASERSATVWIPLQETPLEMGPLGFAERSHTFEFGRNLPISDESEKLINQALRDNGFKFIFEPFELGEVSFHYGWTFHAAGENRTGKARKVMTIIYIDEEMRLAEPKNGNQRNDMRHWCPGVKIGETINSDINPVLFS